MKKLLLILGLAGILSSCNDWLDLDSSTEITEDDMFATGEGFRSAVNGVYRLLEAKELYSGDLNCGMVSVMANSYNLNNLDYYYKYLATGQYETGYSRFITDKVWEKGFNVIANCNNIIQHAEGKDSLFFERGNFEKRMVLGEAKGIRAMMHLDLLRLYAPAPVVADKGKTYFPYVTEYPTYKPVYLGVEAALDKIIEDLTAAAEALEPVDKSEEMAAIWSDEYDRVDGIKPRNFFECRGTRMNYFAAEGLLARAYLYKGDKAKALSSAKKVYEYIKEDAAQRWFRFTPENRFNANQPDDISRKMYDDLIFSVFNRNLWDLFKEKFTNSWAGWSYLVYKNVDALFGTDRDDFRKVALIARDGSTIRWAKPEGDRLRGNVELQGCMAPVIRSTEIYYIMAECMADQDLEGAVGLLEKVRIARGCKNALPAEVRSSKDAFMDVLANEVTREFMSEAQSFYFYKRLNLPMFNGQFPLDWSKNYVLPYPNSETNY